MGAGIRVFSVDDNPHIREGLAMLINSQPGMGMVAQASNGREAIEGFREHKPDVTLMDLRLPDISGIDALIAIRAEFPDARIIILSTFQSERAQRALAEGACAYLLKTTHPLVERIEPAEDAAGTEAAGQRCRGVAEKSVGDVVIWWDERNRASLLR